MPLQKFIGVATADLALDRIRAMVRAARLRGAAESGRGGTHEYAFLVSRAGKIIVHPNEELMIRQGFPGADLTSRPGGEFIAAKPEGFAAIDDGWRTAAGLLGDLAADRLEDPSSTFPRMRSWFPCGN